MDVEVVHYQVDGLGLGIFQGQVKENLGEFKTRAVRRREGEMAPRFRLYRAENIGRAAAFIFVVPSRFPPRCRWRSGRTSACNVTGFSSRQTTGWLGSYGRSYVSSTSSIFEMYSSLRSATHHIFFPPRLEVVVEQQNADGFSSHSGNQSPLHGFFDHQPHGPARAAPGGSLQTMAIMRCFWPSSSTSAAPGRAFS